jgi:SAM-dependent methyltransferase
MPELNRVKLEGALFANALHFVEDAASALASAAQLVRPSGRLVIVEYDRREPSPWVPFPISSELLPALAAQAGDFTAEIVGRRPSAFRGTMYCALLTKSG